MKRYYSILMTIVLGLSACQTKIEHAKTASVRVEGNCGMCKETIESAGSEAGISKVVWNKRSKIAEITFDQAHTTVNLVLKKIALAGYDNEAFRAKSSAYQSLPNCCHYKRLQ